MTTPYHVIYDALEATTHAMRREQHQLEALMQEHQRPLSAGDTVMADGRYAGTIARLTYSPSGNGAYVRVGNVDLWYLLSELEREREARDE